MTEQDKPKVASLLDDHDPAISSLYRQSAQEVPPTSLDDQILRAAHAAVSAQEDAPIVHNPRRRWPLLGGLAASVLVAVLAVKLLPHSLQSPVPTLKERATIGTSEADSLVPKPAELPAATVSEEMPASPTAASEKRMPQEAATLNLADELENKAERKSTAGMATDRTQAPIPSTVTGLPEEMNTESSKVRDEEFNSIVAVWQAGNTTEAIARFEVFKKQYPDYTPSSTDLPVFQTLQSALETKTQSYGKDVK